jgi:hypothetical protein
VKDGEAAYRAACERGDEGVIAKLADSPYEGGRSTNWLKFKCVRDQEFVVGGYTAPKGSRVGLGALLVGYYEGKAWSTPARWEPVSTPPRCEACTRDCLPSSATRHRSRAGSGHLEPLPTGCIQSWSCRSDLPSGHATANCATRATPDYAPIRTPPRLSGRHADAAN